MQNHSDSSKSRDSSSSMNSSIDYQTPIRTQRDVEYYYSAASPNHKSPSSGGGSGLSSQNSSTFPPKSSICNSVYLTPPSSSSSNEGNYQITTEDRLYFTRLILLHEQLMEKYGLCCGYLEDSSRKVDILREENAALRLLNKDLIKRLNQLTEVSVNPQKDHRPARISSVFPSLSIINEFRTLGIGDHNRGSTGGGGGGGSGGPNNTTAKDNNRVASSREAPVTSPTSVFGINDKGFDEKPVQVQPERVSLPKSISIRSSAYLKMNHAKPARTNTTAPPSNKHTNRLRVASAPFVPGVKPRVQLPSIPAVDESKKERVDDQKKAKDPLELDVYNQGTSKTELCNKWQETGVCPYGDHCQFAHGIRELRPVIRHPRYKTEVCRMVLTGGFCPYGHRCHFRHALTDQEKRTGTTTS